MLRTIDASTSILQRIRRAGATALVGVFTANLLIGATANAAFDVPNTFPLLHPGPALAWTAFFVILLAGLRGRLELRGPAESRSFVTVALGGLAALLCVDVMLLSLSILPGTAGSSIATLMTMQAASTALCIYFLNAP